MRKNTFLRVGLVLTALVVGFIVLGLFWTPYSPNAMDFSRLLPPSAAHPMATVPSAMSSVSPARARRTTSIRRS